MSLPTNLSKPNTLIAGTDALAADINGNLDYIITAQNASNTQTNTNTDEIVTARNGAASLDERLDAADTDRGLKAYADNAALTGIPTVPTAAVDTNTFQAASTAFVIAQAGAATPIQDAETAVVGTSTRFSRQDHVHPINPQVAADAASASSSATSAQGYMLTAVSASASAEAAWDNFDDRYLGSKTVAPTLDNDGNALVAGTLYWNNTSMQMNVYNGSAWVAVYLPATGYATLTGTETLTNKTLTLPTITGSTDTVYAITGTTPVISAVNGNVQTWTLSAASSPTDSLAAGQSIMLLVTAGASAITWPSVTWTKAGGSGTAPTLSATGKSAIILWKVATTLYGSYLGDV